jgi:MYXO-CTERM domain-containing protein
MILDWAPSTSPQIDLVCFSQNNSKSYPKTWACEVGSLTNGSISDATNTNIPTTQQPPVNFTFTTTANQKDDNDLVFCHFVFIGNTDGNTVVFQFMNNATEQPTIWKNGVSSSSSSTNTSSPTSISSPMSQKSHKGGLSVGATAGIAAGAGLAVLAVMALGLLFLWRRRKHQKRKTWTEESEKKDAFMQDESPSPQKSSEAAEEQAGAYPSEMAGESTPSYGKTNGSKQGQSPVELMNSSKSPVELMDGSRQGQSPVELMNSNRSPVELMDNSRPGESPMAAVNVNRSPVELMDANERYNFR